MIELNAAAFEELGRLVLDEQVKGFPFGAGQLHLAEVGRQGWSLLRGDIPFPAAVLSAPALRHNSSWMRSFIQHNGLKLAPHGKTTMSPQLFRLQHEDGAWAMTVATVQQLAICLHFGFRRIIIANQVVGSEELDYLFSKLMLMPDLEIYCLIDSLAGVELIAAAGQRAGGVSRLSVLVEVGIAGGRAGCRTFGDAMDVARAAVVNGLTLRGVEGFEGILAAADDVGPFLSLITDVARACVQEDLISNDGPVVLTAGGSVFYDEVALAFLRQDIGRPIEIVIRSGCYLTHDSLVIEQAYRAVRERDHIPMPQDDPRPALSMWARVQSRPETGRVILTMGRRDVSFDAGLPLALTWFRKGVHHAPIRLTEGHFVTALNDQHCYLACPEESELTVGDIVIFGISHPCTTFDKWQLLYIVDADFKVVDAIKTFF